MWTCCMYCSSFIETAPKPGEDEVDVFFENDTDEVIEVWILIIKPSYIRNCVSSYPYVLHSGSTLVYMFCLENITYAWF